MSLCELGLGRVDGCGFGEGAREGGAGVGALAEGGVGAAEGDEGAPDAVRSAIELTRQLADMTWPDNALVRLRIGLHTGWPEVTRSGYVGLDVHRAARIMAAAHGGQIVASAAVISALGRTDTLAIRPFGRYALRGISEPVALFGIEAQGLPSGSPVPRAELVK